MIKAIIVDFSGVIFFHQDPRFDGSHNKLHDELAGRNDYKIFDYFKLNEELLNYLQKLKNKYKLFIFSAGNIQNESEVREKLDFIFDRIFSVDDIGFSKNDERSYLEISKKINIKPEEIIFIDDTLENVNAAQKAGLQATRFINNQNLINSLK